MPFLASDILYFCEVMSKNFRNKFRRKAIQRAVHNNHRNVIFPELHGVRTVGLIVSDNQSEEQNLKKMIFDADIFWLRFVTDKREKDEISESIFINDLDFWGLPKSGKIETFIQKPFDLLINLSDETTDAIEFVCAKSVARFKVSSKSNGLIYDLVISGITDNYTLIEEIRKTLNNFNKRA
jgi:hypothetical protein